jgi:hypothetical protein
MLGALERNLAVIGERIVLLAPSASAAAGGFRNIIVDARRHRTLVRDVQRFRGAIYLKDGAIQPHQLYSGGLHRTPEDERAWHVVSLDTDGQVNACALYLEHEATVAFDDLRVRHSALALDPEWRPRLSAAIASELARARDAGLRYVELGGWAVAEQCRGTSRPLALALAVYGFSRRGAGGALGMTTATFRHCSATILKRLGGSRFDICGVELPPYFDPHYNCIMEMLRFDSRRPNPKYLALIDALKERLAEVLVVARPALVQRSAWCGMSISPAGRSCRQCRPSRWPRDGTRAPASMVSFKDERAVSPPPAPIAPADVSATVELYSTFRKVADKRPAEFQQG